ncbi:MAG: hypothetical protein LBH00_06840, partial [Planctomycetaceae bacterium]|nr:hypothetical protein [Planctomycetaceae bacterium]
SSIVIPQRKDSGSVRQRNAVLSEIIPIGFQFGRRVFPDYFFGTILQRLPVFVNHLPGSKTVRFGVSRLANFSQHF